MERRGFKRLPAECEVTVRPRSGGRRRSGTGKNISGGGILFSTTTLYKAGDLLDIEVLTTTHQKFQHIFQPLQAQVRVVRVKGEKPPFEVAAEFVGR